MYFKDFIVGLRRRWYLVLIGLVVTAGLCFGITKVVPVTYTTTTSLLMLPPRSAVTSKSNPYLNLNGLGQALEVMSTRINASDQARAITDAHPTAAIDVGPDPTTAGPILLISSTARSVSEATDIRDQLTQLAPQVLVTMQDELSIQPNSRITISLLAQDPEPKKVIKGQLRALIAVAAVGGAATILGTGYLDYFLALRSGAPVRRRKRRSAPGAAAGDDGWWDTSDAPDETGASVPAAVAGVADTPAPVVDTPAPVVEAGAAEPADHSSSHNGSGPSGNGTNGQAQPAFHANGHRPTDDEEFEAERTSVRAAYDDER